MQTSAWDRIGKASQIATIIAVPLSALALIVAFLAWQFPKQSQAVPGPGGRSAVIGTPLHDGLFYCILALCLVLTVACVSNVWALRKHYAGARAVSPFVSESTAITPATKSLLRFAINFDYLPRSPLQCGWTVANYSSPMDPAPRFSPLTVRSEIRLDMIVAGLFAMDHAIAKNGQLSKVVEFSAIYHDSPPTMIYVGLRLRKDGKRVDNWLKIEHGVEREPELNKGYETEYVIWMQGEPEMDGWTKFRIDLSEHHQRTWQKHGYELEAITRVRLRGSLCISPIRLYS